jgi:hypothetical protein
MIQIPGLPLVPVCIEKAEMPSLDNDMAADD